jgi:hypothetical protein
MKGKKTFAAVTAALLLSAGTGLAQDAFTMLNIRDSRVYGPFRLKSGETIHIDGASYQLLTPAAGRVSFKSLANGIVYGPLQVVDGRLGVVGNATYRLKPASAASVPAQAAATPRAEPFVPQPPAMPEKIPVPEQQRRVVPAKDLRALPETTPVLRALAWLAPMDNTPLDWKIDSSSAGDGAIERVSLGGEAEWNHWVASVTLSPVVESGGIAKGGSGITGASLKDGTGWSIGGGYRRPFLVEGGWSASAGLRGQIRQDSGDLTAHTVASSSHTDTNGVVSVLSERRTETSSITVRELSLWIDLELAYSQDVWGIYADVSIEPVSEYDVSGSIKYGEGSLSIDAERSLPLSATFGGWYRMDNWRFFADLTLGNDERLRLGCGYDF